MFPALAVFAQKDCTKKSIDRMSVSQLGTATYRGLVGGLYPDGENLRPFNHTQNLEEVAILIKGRRVDGRVDNTDGSVVMLGIGNGSAGSSFAEFARIAKADTVLSSRVHFINGCRVEVSLDALQSSSSAYWAEIGIALESESKSGSQVQVVWLQAEDLQNSDTAFPTSAVALAEKLRAVCETMRNVFPNLRIVYLSSRPYAGYADHAALEVRPGLRSPRDNSYGWAVKFLVENQLKRIPGYTFGTESDPIPGLTWCTDDWADGDLENSVGLKWECSDFDESGIELSPSGAVKTGSRIYQFVSKDVISQPWFHNPMLVSVKDFKIENQDNGLVKGPFIVVDVQGRTVYSGDQNILLSELLDGLHAGLYFIQQGSQVHSVIRQ